MWLELGTRRGVAPDMLQSRDRKMKLTTNPLIESCRSTHGCWRQGKVVQYFASSTVDSMEVQWKDWSSTVVQKGEADSSVKSEAGLFVFLNRWGKYVQTRAWRVRAILVGIPPWTFDLSYWRKLHYQSMIEMRRPMPTSQFQFVPKNMRLGYPPEPRTVTTKAQNWVYPSIWKSTWGQVEVFELNRWRCKSWKSLLLTDPRPRPLLRVLPLSWKGFGGDGPVRIEKMGCRTTSWRRPMRRTAV